MRLKITSDGNHENTRVMWEDGSEFPLPVHRLNITIDARGESRTLISCFPPAFETVAEAAVEITDPYTGKVYRLVEIGAEVATT